MKFNDFRVNDYSSNIRSDSKFFNNDNMKEVMKTVTFFNNYFINGTLLSRLESNAIVFDYNIPNDLIDRINAFAMYMYDESFTAYGGYNRKPNENKDSNLNILRITLGTKLLLAYSSGLVKRQTVEVVDKYFANLFYKLVVKFNAFDDVDRIIYYKGNRICEEESDCDDEQSRFERPVTVEEWKNKDLKPDYDYNRDKETALITSFIRANVNFFSRNIDLSYVVGCKYNSYLNIVNDMDPFSKDFNFVNKCALFNLLKDVKIQTMCKNMKEEEKNIILEKINDLLNNSVFDSITKFREINAALAYAGERPYIECEKMMNKYIGDYKYTGVVYHGFFNINGTPDVLSVLRHYENGFISCSKDLRTAKNFSRNSNSGIFGGILEIYIDEDMEAIDIEKILEDAYNKEKSIYRGMYNSFINEKEVLIKMPIKKYRLLTPIDVNKILGDDQYLSEYTPENATKVK